MFPWSGTGGADDRSTSAASTRTNYYDHFSFFLEVHCISVFTHRYFRLESYHFNLLFLLLRHPFFFPSFFFLAENAVLVFSVHEVWPTGSLCLQYILLFTNLHVLQINSIWMHKQWSDRKYASSSSNCDFPFRVSYTVSQNAVNSLFFLIVKFSDRNSHLVFFSSCLRCTQTLRDSTGVSWWTILGLWFSNRSPSGLLTLGTGWGKRIKHNGSWSTYSDNTPLPGLSIRLL